MANEPKKLTLLSESKDDEKKVVQFRDKRIEIPSDLNGRVILKNFYNDEISAKLVNLSKFGIRISIPQDQSNDIISSQKFNEIKILISDQIVFSGSGTIVSDGFVKDNVVSFGMALDSDSIDLDKVSAVMEVHSDSSVETILHTKRIIELSSQIRPDFKCLVADLNTIFQDLKFKLLKEEEKIQKLEMSNEYKVKMEEQIITLAMSIYGEEIHNLFSKFKDVVDLFGHDEIALHKRYFRSNFHPNVLNSPFVKRAFEKPLGYAGDFGLMVMLYDYQDIGGNLFEKFIHRFSCNEPASIANKNRVEFLAEYIHEVLSKTKESSLKISSIACGPAKEIELLVEKLDDHVPTSFVLVDQESKALEYAQQRIKLISKKKNFKTVFLEEDAVLGFIKGKNFVNQIRDSNIIVSAGLFDYLSDKVSKRLIAAFFELLKPGGTILIGNVSKNNPDRFSMDYFMEWNLILRSPEDLYNIVPDEIKNSSKVKVEVTSELLGLNLFLSIKKLK